MYNQNDDSKFEQDTKLALALSMLDQQSIINEQVIENISKLEYKNLTLQKRLEGTEKHVQSHAERLSRIETLLTEIKKVEEGAKNLSKYPSEVFGMNSDEFRSLRDHITNEIAKVKSLLGLEERNQSKAMSKFGKLLSLIHERLPIFDIQLGQFSFANENSAIRTGYGNYRIGFGL